MLQFNDNYRILDTKLATFKKFVSHMNYRIAPRKHIDLNGRSLLYLIVRSGTKRLQINLNHYVEKKDWDSKKQRLKISNQSNSSTEASIYF